MLDEVQLPLSEAKTDLQLLALRFKETRDERIFTLIYQRIVPKLTVFVMKIVSDEERAGDIVNDALLAVYQNMEKYNTRWRFTTYVYTIAKHRALAVAAQMRRQRSIANIEFEYLDHNRLDQYDTTVLDLISEQEQRQILYDATLGSIQKLREPFREVALDRFIENRSIREISESLGIRPGTVRTRLYRSKEMVRREVIQMMGAEDISY
jgi:RNA polymerase sigma-70 factor, ECF subfamily